MNWTRIFAATALATWVLGASCSIWFSSTTDHWVPHHEHRWLKTSRTHASILLEFHRVERPVQVAMVRSSEMDVVAYGEILRSQAIMHRLFVALSSWELRSVVGPDFYRNGVTNFRGLRVTADGLRYNLRISASHDDPEAAEFLAKKLLEQLIQYCSALESGADSYYLDLLLHRKAELQTQATETETRLERLRESKDRDAVEKAEEVLRVSQESIRTIETRVSAMRESMKKPPVLPFHVVSAQVTRGPLWNRVTTDFTAEAQRLVER